jgi:phosphate starvation-inducible protein PhoH
LGIVGVEAGHQLGILPGSLRHQLGPFGEEVEEGVLRPEAVYLHQAVKVEVLSAQIERTESWRGVL